MASQTKLDALYMDIAARVSQMSLARRLKVGAIIVKGDNIISLGWNGTPAGMDNSCEVQINGELMTKPEVLHAESNCLMKLVATGNFGATGSTMYTTHSPCPECAKLIKQAKIARVVYLTEYRIRTGIDMLHNFGVATEKFS